MLYVISCEYQNCHYLYIGDIIIMLRNQGNQLKNCFNFSITVDIQYYISLRCTT